MADATEATVYVSIATSFNGFDKNPATNGVNNNAIASNQLAQAQQLGWNEIKKRHIKDYQKYFKRVELKINNKEISKNVRILILDNFMEASMFLY